jgi:hypothetical protein
VHDRKTLSMQLHRTLMGEHTYNIDVQALLYGIAGLPGCAEQI